MKRVIECDPAESAPADPCFAESVIRWQKQHGRNSLPWQATRDPYRIWLSEIMLQQTQVATVIPYYQRFLTRFPDVVSLADAPVEEVMAHWSGLGYYTRARNLHRCAQRVRDEYGGAFPADPALLADLPGIGRSTAAAIAAFSHGVRAAILDGNVKRVFCRVFGIEGYPGTKPVEAALWRRAESLLPRQSMEAYTQGLMDLGATVCTRSKPSCKLCPLQAQCVAYATGRTEVLPTRKPAKALPEKQTVMLVVVDEGKVLLEQRPGHGIWGGLLSLPELNRLIAEEVNEAAEMSQALQHAVAAFGTLDSLERLQDFSHTFTHYKLHVSPYLLRLKQGHAKQIAPPYCWVRLAQLEQAALPAPVKKLLGRLLLAPDLLSLHS